MNPEAWKMGKEEERRFIKLFEIEKQEKEIGVLTKGTSLFRSLAGLLIFAPSLFQGTFLDQNLFLNGLFIVACLAVAEVFSDASKTKEARILSNVARIRALFGVIERERLTARAILRGLANLAAMKLLAEQMIESRRVKDPIIDYGIDDPLTAIEENLENALGLSANLTGLKIVREDAFNTAKYALDNYFKRTRKEVSTATTLPTQAASAQTPSSASAVGVAST